MRVRPARRNELEASAAAIQIEFIACALDELGLLRVSGRLEGAACRRRRRPFKDLTDRSLPTG